MGESLWAGSKCATQSNLAEEGGPITGNRTWEWGQTFFHGFCASVVGQVEQGTSVGCELVSDKEHLEW